MIQESIRIVPFNGLWNMAIDVPYSMLAGRGDAAWSCGQLAMDQNAQVISPGDLSRQSQVVIGFIHEILQRANMQSSSIRRLVLYYVQSKDFNEERLCDLFFRQFGSGVVIDVVAVPQFYYDGVMLEVDVFCGAPLVDSRIIEFKGGTAQLVLTANQAWVSLNVTPMHVITALQSLRAKLAEAGMMAENCLNEHWVAPTSSLHELVSKNISLGVGFDTHAILDGGPNAKHINIRTTILRTGIVETDVQKIDQVYVVTRHCDTDAWIQARATDKSIGLVAQTKSVMKVFEFELERLGANYFDVVKQTAHYVGGSAKELHDNMSVRNAYYSKPGPSSTGIPVFGYVDDLTSTVVDLRIRKGWRG